MCGGKECGRHGRGGRDGGAVGRVRYAVVSGGATTTTDQSPRSVERGLVLRQCGFEGSGTGALKRFLCISCFLVEECKLDPGMGAERGVGRRAFEDFDSARKPGARIESGKWRAFGRGGREQAGGVVQMNEDRAKTRILWEVEGDLREL